MENNDNNLFKNMFGIESEEQPLPEPQPTPVPEQQIIPSVEPLQQTIKPDIKIEQPIIEEIIVLDSNPKPMQQPIDSPVVEQPTLSSINSNQKELPQNKVNYEESSVPTENIYKPICIILGITLLIVVLAFPLYSLVNNSLNKQNEQETTPAVEPEVEETPVTEEKPVTPVLNINFDINAKFDKGYTTNKNEYQRTSSFKPESSEGVVKCENIKPLVHTGGQNNTAIYIYYKDYMSKKLLTIDDIDLNNVTSYNQYIKSFQTITAVTADNEHLFTQLLVDAKAYRVKYHMLVDLAYSQATRIPDSDYYIDISLSYNSPIQSAMNKFLGNKNYIGNMCCSTIITQDASL